MSNQRKSDPVPAGLYLDKILDEARHLARAAQPPSDGIGVPRFLEPRLLGQSGALLDGGLPIPGDPLWPEEDETGELSPGSGDRGTNRFTNMADRYRRMIEVYVSRTPGNA